MAVPVVSALATADAWDIGSAGSPSGPSDGPQPPAVKEVRPIIRSRSPLEEFIEFPPECMVLG